MLEDRLLLSTTWFVDNSLARSGDGTTLAKAFSTISRGISAAHDGDIVVVEPGSYHDNLRINKPIRLVGSGAGCTTLTAASGGAAAVSIGFHHSDTGIITTQPDHR
jgi:nitrous oxidase accessory protein NosD